MKSEFIGFLKSAFQRAFNNDAAEEARRKALEERIAEADERLAGFSSRKQKPDEPKKVIVDDTFHPNLKGEGYQGKGVIDKGGYIKVIGNMTPEKAAIVAQLAQKKGWGTIAACNSDGRTLNPQATQVLMSIGLRCVTNPKELGSFGERMAMGLALWGQLQEDLFKHKQAMKAAETPQPA